MPTDSSSLLRRGLLVLLMIGAVGLVGDLVLLEHYEEQRKLLKFKDDVIWKLSQELKKKYDYYQDEFDKETRHEMNEWARLVDRYACELKKYELVCSFCG